MLQSLIAMYSAAVLCFILVSSIHAEFTEPETSFTNTWAVEISGGPEVAKRVAEEHGYEIVRQVSHDSRT